MSGKLRETRTKRFGAEQIIPKLREAEVDLAKGQTVAQVCKKIGGTEQTYYRWRVEYNAVRPHSSLRYRPPAPEAIQTGKSSFATLRWTSPSEQADELT